MQLQWKIRRPSLQWLICARAATVDVDSVVQWRPEMERVMHCSGGARGASCHWLCAHCRSTRVCRWSVAAHGEPRTESRRPPPLFIAQCDRGPPAIDGLGAPD